MIREGDRERGRQEGGRAKKRGAVGLTILP